MRRCLHYTLCTALAVVIVHALTGCRPQQPRTAPIARPSADVGAAARVVRINARVNDPARWFAAHGATESLDRDQHLDACVELVVGAAGEPALLCDEQEVVTRGLNELAVYRVVVHRVVRVVRAGSIQSVLDGRTALLAARQPYPRARGILELTLRIARDGRSATVEASTTDDCKTVQPPEPEPYLPGQEVAPEERDWVRADRYFEQIWVERLCSERGSFVWQGDRFERVLPEIPLLHGRNARTPT